MTRHLEFGFTYIHVYKYIYREREIDRLHDLNLGNFIRISVIRSETLFGSHNFGHAVRSTIT